MESGKNPIKAIIEGDFDSRVHDLAVEGCTFTHQAQIVQEWRQQGRFFVFNAGTYDILTLNHILGLVQCRALGAMALLEIENIKTEQDRHLVHGVAASDSIGLMVTLDTNLALEERKSRRPEKGGAPKPTLDWSSRAIILAMQSIPAPDYKTRRSVVDYITRHGPECCTSCEPGKCINEDNAKMALGLQPDLVVVNSQSLQTIDDLKGYQDGGLLPNTVIRVVDESENYYMDPVLGGAVTTTSIIKRVRS